MPKNPPQSQKNQENVVLSRIRSVVLLLILAFSLFFAQSALWVNHIVFNQQAFVDISTKVITSENSRDAIAQTVVDKALANRPVAERLVGDRASNFISGLLGSDVSQNVLNKVANSAYAYMTSSNRQDIAIDLSSIQQPITQLLAFAQSQGRETRIQPENIPEKITLVKSDELPDIAKYMRQMIIASFFLWLATIVSLIAYIFWGDSKHRVRRVYLSGLVIIVVSLIGLSAGPYLPSVIASFVENINLRGVVNDLAAAYLAPFSQQMYVTILITVVVLACVRFRWIFIKGWASAQSAISRSISTKPTKEK